jgi:hypothetical protein
MGRETRKEGRKEGRKGGRIGDRIGKTDCGIALIPSHNNALMAIARGCEKAC